MKPWLLSLVLAGLTLVAYAQVRDHQYLNYDDDLYVVENAAIQDGFSLESLRWAATTTHDGLRIPVTWVSFLVDAELWDLRPGAVLLTNVAYHTLSGLLLFWALVAATGARYRSAFVAAVFLLHPIHAESVAWASERKDVLCGLFWNATFALYVRYAKKPSVLGYAAVVLGHGLALAAKPMAVTLPAALLLLDFWPLRRFGDGAFAAAPLRRALLEKLPLVALSALTMFVTYGTQRADGTMRDLETISLLDRVGNACLSYVSYVAKAILPLQLSVFYPYREELGLGAVLAGVALLIVTLASLRFLWRAPYFTTGWLWFLGTLIPVIGLIQVGQQSMANRYAYLPLIGLGIGVAWGADALAEKFSARRILAAAALLASLGMTALTLQEVGHWKNGVTLFNHALAADPSNATARANLGIAHLIAGDVEQGVSEMVGAYGLQIQGPRANAAVRDILLGNAKAAMKEPKPWLAITLLKPAIAVAPNSIPVHAELGRAYFLEGRYDEALEHFERARYNDEKLADFHAQAAEALEVTEDVQAARIHYQKAIERAERAITKHQAHGITHEARALRRLRRDWERKLNSLPGSEPR